MGIVARKYSARDLERMALHYAIEEREGFLASLGEAPADAVAAQRARALIFGWKAMMARRFGSPAAAEPISRVSIFEIMTAAKATFPKGSDHE